MRPRVRLVLVSKKEPLKSKNLLPLRLQNNNSPTNFKTEARLPWPRYLGIVSVQIQRHLLEAFQVKLPRS